MIKTIKHKALKALFIHGDAKGINPSLRVRTEYMLDALDTAEIVNDMNVPGAFLHELKGDRKGIWSVRISGN